jgi:ADP-ribose pyrophosphatase
MNQFSLKDVKVIHRNRVFQGFFAVDQLTISHRLFEGGWSEPFDRELFERGDAVAVLPYDPVRDQVLLIEQFRAGALNSKQSPWMYEVVAGIVEPGETEQQVALREAQEEAGAELEELFFIQDSFPSPGGCSEKIALFIGKVDAKHDSGIHGLDEEFEDIRVLRLDMTELKALVDAGKIENLPCLASVQWLLLNHQFIRERWL